MKKLLHIGCGGAGREQVMLEDFRREEWDHLRVDIDSNVLPDVVDDMRTLVTVEDSSVDGVYSSHNLEHLHPNDSLKAMQTFLRVLKPGGIFFAVVPDVQIACEWIARGDGLKTIYQSAAGPITPIDMVYGYRPFTFDNPFQMHRMGFTVAIMDWMIREAGFTQCKVQNGSGFDVWAYGEKNADS